MSAFEKIYTHLWMLVPAEERAVLIDAFELEKTGVAEIKDQTVISDGFSNDDLAKITKEKMESFIGSEEENFTRAWEITVAKAKSIVNPAIEIKMPEGAQPLREATPEEAAAMIAKHEAGQLGDLAPTTEEEVQADMKESAPVDPTDLDAHTEPVAVVTPETTTEAEVTAGPHATSA